MNDFIQELKSSIEGDVRDDQISKKIYSVDASIYEVEPKIIVIPKTKHDLIETVKIASKHKVPLIPRGAATGITGGCLGPGIIIDTSKYLNKIIKINTDKEYAIVQPGVVQDDLNHALLPFGYRLGPDTSTGNRATIGGMLANNAAGARSLYYGKMIDHVLETELILSSGETICFKELNNFEWEQKRNLQNSEGHIYSEIYAIKEKYHKEIAKHFPKIPRRVSGYNLDELINDQPLNVSKLITGSEGSLGIIAEIKVKISKTLPQTGLCVLHYNSMQDAMGSVETLLSFTPISLELIDDKIIEMGRNSPAMKNKLGWLKKSPTALLAIELEQEKLLSFEKENKTKNYACVTLTDENDIANVWALRKSGLGLLLSKRSYNRAIAFIEDITLSPDKLDTFMEKFLSYLKSEGKEAGIYGHAGSGCLHIRPYIDLRQESELKKIKKMMLDISDLLLEYGGALSGEHGDGFIRSWLNKKMFGNNLYQAFTQLKQAFDPDNLMNPGKIVHARPVTENLRMNPTVTQNKIKTFLNFSNEGGFELAVDMCNGNAMCRKKEGLMCPSFQATQDEYDSTRARAQTLRSIINGRLPLKELKQDKVRDVLDLCIECKGCKKECPSQVDMAKMKSELLYQQQQEHGANLRSRLLGHIPTLYLWAQPFKHVLNKLRQSKIFKKSQSLIGLSPKRTLPKFSEKRFSEQFKTEIKDKKVVLFNDTFTEFNEPQIGHDAVSVLNALGYEVICPKWQCCGRPLISKGFLKQAAKKALTLINHLYPYAKKGLPIIGLEPSCILTIKDDLKDFPGISKLKIDTIIKHATTFDEFIHSHIKDGKLPLAFTEREESIKIHGHCHQKALVGTTPTRDVLNSVPGFKVTEIPSGCCGMAGSFGYEKEHYEISMKIGSLVLFPAIQKSKETLICANGFSCRNQIKHGTKRDSQHLASILAEKLQKNFF